MASGQLAILCISPKDISYHLLVIIWQYRHVQSMHREWIWLLIVSHLCI